jgi:hypothetical protein
MRRVSHAVVFSVLLATGIGQSAEAASACGSEPTSPSQLKSQVLSLLLRENFNELERLADDFRRKKSRFSDGTWMLYSFYRALREPENRSSPQEWARHIDHLERWAKAKPKSVTTPVALETQGHDIAWRARGSGFAHTVTEEGWRLFAERLEKAREVLEEAEKLPPKDPEIYRAFLKVGQGQNWPREKYDAVFKKGAETEPDYHHLHAEKAQNLLPRWHGKPGELEKFAEEAANAAKNRDGGALYARIAVSVLWTAHHDDFFDEYRFSRERMKRGFTEVEKQFPNSNLNLNRFCLLACLAGDRETARQLFQRIGNTPMANIWKSEGRFEQWKKWAHGESAPPRPKREQRPSPPPEFLEEA